MDQTAEALLSPSPDSRTWKDLLSEEKREDYFKDLLSFIERERNSGKIIFPPNREVFHALQATPFGEVRVVILGQDPYHGDGQAHGLCFSVQPGIKPPPSLMNIFLELHSDLGIAKPAHGCLEKWTKQGVLLLNSVLTVERSKPASHAGMGWERFTDKIITLINEHKDGVVFLLWGSYAQKKGEVIDRTRHLVLEAPHPSPFSAHRGFLGCKHFSRANHYLKMQGREEIDWRI